MVGTAGSFATRCGVYLRTSPSGLDSTPRTSLPADPIVLVIGRPELPPVRPLMPAASVELLSERCGVRQPLHGRVEGVDAVQPPRRCPMRPATP